MITVLLFQCQGLPFQHLKTIYMLDNLYFWKGTKTGWVLEDGAELSCSISFLLRPSRTVQKKFFAHFFVKWNKVCKCIAVILENKQGSLSDYFHFRLDLVAFPR